MAQKADASGELLRACEHFSTDADLEVVADLIEKKGDVNYQDGCTGLGPLHFAAYHGSLKLAKLLFQANASVDIADRGQLTPLHLACHENKSVEIVDFLCDVGADASALDSLKGTPLHWAVYRGNYDLVEALLGWESGKEATRVLDAIEYSPMDYAKFAQRADIKKILLEPPPAKSGRYSARQGDGHRPDTGERQRSRRQKKPWTPRGPWRPVAGR